MASLRSIKRKIKSVKSIQQITYAMKMVSSIRLKYAKDKLAGAQPYSENLKKICGRIIAKTAGDPGQGGQHPLVKQGRPGRLLLIVVSGDRGLCGSFNAAIVKKAIELVRNSGEVKIDVIAVGRKVRSALLFQKIDTISGYEIANMRYSDAEAVALDAMNLYSQGVYEAVHVLYSQFKSVLRHPVAVENFLPVDMSGLSSKEKAGDCIFEPAPEKLLPMLIPAYVKSRLYSILLESVASENAARMMAMDSATKNADEVIKDMTLKSNKIRQEKITQELSEITSGSNF